MNVSSLTLNSRLAFFFYCFSVDALPDLPLLVWELWQADDGKAFGGGARHDVRVRRPGRSGMEVTASGLLQSHSQARVSPELCCLAEGWGVERLVGLHRRDRP